MSIARMIAPSQINKLINRISLYDDAVAYKELFLLYHAKLIQFSSLITGNREYAEEVVSDVFLKFWNNRNKLSRVDNFHLYAYIATKNQSLNYLRKINREKVFSLDEVVIEFKSLYYDPEQLMITAEMFNRIRKAIDMLPPRCQLIFKLIKEDGLMHREVAELLNLSLKTVENQMTIALKKIGQSIEFVPRKSSFT
jgi:RNA polymerase sigma-70 factor (family 1)